MYSLYNIKGGLVCLIFFVSLIEVTTVQSFFEACNLKFCRILNVSALILKHVHSY
jgi:hypothetical protein